MKNTIALLATAANIGSVAATFGHGGWGGGFHDAPSFTCPGNHDNICVDDQIGGWDWSNLNPGSFDSYFGFDFNGWTCRDDNQRRDVSKRSFGGGKRISAKCGHSVEQAPSFGCGSNANVDNFSVSSFQIAVEFDCRLEFHYNMPDGSTCKHSAHCSPEGTTVPNTQCGGATDVHVVFPEQPDVPSNECGIDIHHIDFDCDDNTPPPPAETSPPPPAETSPPPASETTPPPADETTPPADETTPPPADETTPPPADETTPPPADETTPPPADETTPPPEETAPTTFPSSSFSNSTSVPPTSTPVSSTEELPTSSIPPPESTPESSPTSSPVSTPITTTYDSTSTVFTTTIETITSCAPEVPDCPGAGQTTVLTHTVAISTTICPVTETITPTPVPTESPEEPENPEQPEEPLPCPPVVPSCLNTFLNVVADCKDNLDVACFCPNQEFLDQVYACVYAHADSDDIVSEGLAFIQGICAPYIPENPGIVTGIETITNIITVTGTPTVTSVPYTTVVIATTVTEPCVSNGVTISTSSTTRTITSEVTIPQITLPPTAPVPEPTGPVPSTISTRPGTISNPPVPTTTGTVPIAGAAKVNAGLGLGLAVIVAMAL